MCEKNIDLVKKDKKKLEEEISSLIHNFENKYEVEIGNIYYRKNEKHSENKERVKLNVRIR